MKALQYIKYYGGGILVLVLVFFVVHYAIAKYHRPGSQTVLEAQAMDVTQMAAPTGTVPVAVETVREDAFAPTVTYTGSVVAYSDADVYPRVTGTLTSLAVYPGQQVHIGQVVARLDSVELSSRVNEAAAAREASLQELETSQSELQQAIAQKRMAEAKITSLHSAERDALAQIDAMQAMQDQSRRERDAAVANEADAMANIRAMQADADYWKNEIAREEKLLQAKAVSREEYERERSQAQAAQAKLTQAQAGVSEKKAMIAAADSKIRQAEANVVSAQAKREQARSDIQSAEAELAAASAAIKAGSSRIRNRKSMAQQSTAQERTAAIIRDYTEIRALQDGVVTERLVSPGTLVQPGMALLRIKTIDRVRLQANVAETDLAGIQVGSAVSVTTPRDPQFHLKTSVTSIFNAANPQSRTVIVEALTPNSGGRLIPGQYVVMQIAIAATRHVVTVPQTAIRRNVDQKPYVWTVVTGANGNKSTAHRVPVTLGSADEQRVVVQSGLRAGDQVIYQGHEYLNEGDSVTPAEWTQEGPRTLPAGPGTMAPMPGMDMGNGNSMPGMKMDGKSNTQGTPEREKGDMKDMPGMGQGNMPGMDHSKMPDMPGMDHSKMPGMGGR